MMTTNAWRLGVRELDFFALYNLSHPSAAQEQLARACGAWHDAIIAGQDPVLPTFLCDAAEPKPAWDTSRMSRFRAAKEVAFSLFRMLGNDIALYQYASVTQWLQQTYQPVFNAARAIYAHARAHGMAWGETQEGAYQLPLARDAAESKTTVLSAPIEAILADIGRKWLPLVLTLSWQGFRHGARATHPGLAVENWLGITDAAARLYRTDTPTANQKAKVQYAIDSGKLPAVRVTNAWLIAPDTFADWSELAIDGRD